MKKLKPLRSRFYEPIYGVNVIAFKNYPEDKWVKYVNQNTTEEELVLDKTVDGHRLAAVKYINPYTYSIAHFENSEFSETELVHELTHLVYRILSIHGINHNIETDEVYAYYTDYWYKILSEFYFNS